MVFPLRCSIGLLACRLGCGGDGVLISSVISSVWDALRCPACPSARLVSRLVRRPVCRVVSSVGSVHRLSPRLATRWAGRRTDAVRLFVSRSILPLLACLGLFLAIHLIRMAATVCGLSARRALLACPVVSVPCRSFRLESRPLHPLARSIDADRCRCPDVMA